LNNTQSWKEEYFENTSSAKLARAKRIVNSYVEPSGKFAVNIASVTAVKIKMALVEEGTEPPQTLFDQAYSEVAQMLVTGPLPRFLDSPEFKKLTE
jgi:hypothetical protein